MKKRTGLLLAVFLAATLLYLLLDFTGEMGAYGRSVYDGGKVDAVVVLTGGTMRVGEGLRLLRRGAAGVLIISGVHRDADIESIFLGISPPLTSMEKKSIILEKRSSSTVENAVEVRRIMEEFGLGSMVLITSNYHMRRAAYTFTTVMPEAVEIKLHAVRSPNFDPSRWWSGRGLWITLSEFVKYRLAVLRFRLGDPAR